MNLLDLTVDQFKRAAALKEQIDRLNKELGSILGVPAKTAAAPKPKPAPKPSPRAAAKPSVAARPAPLSAKPVAKPKTTTMSPATRAKLSAKLKAFWAAKRAGRR